MTPLRFRAWHKKRKEWLTITGIHFDDPETIWIGCDEDLGDVGSYDEPPEPFFAAPLADVELMQSTGLLDKNGKMIYESDVVSLDGNTTADDSMGVLPNGWTFDEDSKYLVVWENAFAGWRLDFSKTSFDDVHKEFGDYTESYIRKYKNHAMSLFVEGKITIIGNLYQNPELLPSPTE